ncbi:hypothetical protein SESBI_01106 [Sesbania bispinosa]|nr:hypothetical protein SESBI_01106 [Sesbania bispinosa]
MGTHPINPEVDSSLECEVKDLPEELQDTPRDGKDETEEIDIGEGGIKKPLFINRNLDKEEKEEVVALLKEFKDIFALEYSEMPGLDPTFVTPRGQAHQASGQEIFTRGMKAPSNMKELQQFIGELGYIRSFVPTLGEFIGPMRDLLKGRKPYEWKEKHQEAFEKVKKTLNSEKVLVSPRQGGP